MKKIFHLKTCNTCQKIIKPIPKDDFEIREIKTTPISEEELKEMFQLSGSFESLFNRRSRQYAARNLKNKVLSESDYKKLLLEEYTFLKRPVIIIDSEIFIGNSKKNIENLYKKLGIEN